MRESDSGPNQGVDRGKRRSAEDCAIMFHAGHVAYLSGASDYSRCSKTSGPAWGFRGPGAVCHDIPADLVAEEHALAWLRARDFERSAPIWVEQHVLSDARHNDGIVVSLLVRRLSCEDDALAALGAIRDALTVTTVAPSPWRKSPLPRGTS